ncbi:hypothetical protein KCP69_25650 [Salmonella enterica subsp. enterica]|nr:hypothetical protein KCP69_25650 [Salmonella enterica subsp. enterica]
MMPRNRLSCRAFSPLYYSALRWITAHLHSTLARDIRRREEAAHGWRIIRAAPCA